MSTDAEECYICFKIEKYETIFYTMEKLYSY